MYGDAYGGLANDIIFSLMQQEAFTEEDFYEMARKDRMPPEAIRWAWKRYLGLFLGAGYIERTDKSAGQRVESWRAIRE